MCSIVKFSISIRAKQNNLSVVREIDGNESKREKN